MSYRRPPSGSMVWWRFNGSPAWTFGYVTYVKGYDMIRMGHWNGDSTGGKVVSINDIEWKERQNG